MKNGFERHLHYYLLLAFLITFVILAFLSEGSVGGADDISHFKFSRYAFKHPEFFLDSWGKPLFTMLMAPFAQFGFIGVKIFNILLGLGTAFLTFLTVKKLNYEYPVLALFLLIFAPMYSILMISGMTEILFSFILILGIYLFFDKRSIASAVVISLLPFVRTEGVVIFPLFLMAYLLNRRRKAIPFLLSGFLLFSIIGSLYYKDFFWVINTMPYKGDAADIYGSGELLYYVFYYKLIFGRPFSLLILGGLLYIPIHFFSKGRDIRKPFLNEMLIGFLPFLVYFAAHSYVWWKGTGNSVGEIRVMAAVFPSAVLLALFAWNGLLRWLPFRRSIKISLSTILAVILVYSTLMMQQIPVRTGPTQELIKRAANWFKASPYAGSKTIYFDPYWWFFLGADPTDREIVSYSVPDVQRPHMNTLPGELIIWDAHYGPNEGRLPLSMLMGNPYFELVNIFRPEFHFRVLGGYEYEIYIFKRVEGVQQEANLAIMEQLLIRQDSAFKYLVLEYHNFESGGNRTESINLSNERVFSGSSSYRINEDLKFITGIQIPVKDFDVREGSKIMASVFHRFDSDQGGEHPRLVISLENNRVPYFYTALEIRPDKLQEWKLLNFEHLLPDRMSPDDILKVYIWNRGSNTFYIDDFTIALKNPR